MNCLTEYELMSYAKGNFVKCNLIKKMCVLLNPVNLSFAEFLLYIRYILCINSSQVAQWVKNLPTMQERQVQSLDWEDPLEEDMTTHSSIFAWRIPMDRSALWTTVHGAMMSWIQLSD